MKLHLNVRISKIGKPLIYRTHSDLERRSPTAEATVMPRELETRMENGLHKEVLHHDAREGLKASNLDRPCRSITADSDRM